MRRVVQLLWLGAFAATVTAANAQAPVPSSPDASGQPGVNVYSTLYPRPPSSTVTQPTANLPNQPGSFVPYPPAGYASGNMIWYPALTAATFYDDNVFALPRNRQGDWAGVIRPELG